MSRKHKLAEEHAKSEGDNGNAETSFLAGYAACEQDAKGLVEAVETLIKEEGYGTNGNESWDAVRENLAKWKERGE